MPKLVIAEKPSVARSITEAIPGFVKREGYYESPEYILTWAIGHLVDLGSPEDYNPAWKPWDLATLPMLPSSWKAHARQKLSGDARKQLETIGKLWRKCSAAINACDAGREGELIFRLIYEYHKMTIPIERLWISSLTKESIAKGFTNIRAGREFDNLHSSALARSVGDWLVGLNATRAFTIQCKDPSEEGFYSVGRVQTPTLAILVKREQEIESFKPEDYYEIVAELNAHSITFPAQWHGPDGPRMKDAAKATEIAQKIHRCGMASVVESDCKTVSEQPRQLYDLTTLQRDANKRYGLTAQQTLDAAQSLYEAKLLTYPRTDSRYISKDIVPTIPGIMANLLGQPAYVHLKGNGSLKNFQRPAVVNDAKVSDHHAIIPTELDPGTTRQPLKDMEAKVYDLVARRFLANALAPAQDRKVRLIFDAAGEKLIANGKCEVDPGWRVAEPPTSTTAAKPKTKGKAADGEEGGDDDAPVPELAEGESAFVERARPIAKQTKAPKRHDEAGLLLAMETAGKDIDDEALREAMKGSGLGTPATRAGVIELLKGRDYIQVEKKNLVPTPNGRRLIELVEQAGLNELASPELTARWEKRLNDMAAGTDRGSEPIEQSFRQYTSKIVDAVRTFGPSHGSRPTLPACPMCGGPTILGRYTVTCSAGGCKLKISRELLKRELDMDDVVALLTRKRTELLGWFTSPNKKDEDGKPKKFSAMLILEDDGSGLKFDFSDRDGTPKLPGGRKAPASGSGPGRRGAPVSGGSRSGPTPRSGANSRPPGQSTSHSGPSDWRAPRQKGPMLQTGVSERKG